MSWNIHEMIEMRKAGFEWTELAEVTGLTAIQCKDKVVNYIHNEIYDNGILE